MFGLSEETWHAITPYVLTALVGLLTALAAWARNREAWLKMKTMEWEHMTKKAMEEAQSARQSSERNHVLLEETAKRTEKLEQNTNGTNVALRQIALTSAFNSGKLKGKLEQIGAVDQDELNAIENEFKESLKSTEDKSK